MRSLSLSLLVVLSVLLQALPIQGVNGTVPAVATTTPATVATTTHGSAATTTHGTTTRATTTRAVTTTSPYAVCANPLFKGWAIVDVDGLRITIDLTTAVPAVFPAANATVCTMFSGQQSCCSANHLKAITLAAEAEAKQIAIAQAKIALEIQNEQLADLKNAAVNFTDVNFVKNCQGFGYPAAACETIVAEVEKFALLKAQLQQDSLTCLAALENYVTGMLCFACTTEWAKFLHTGNLTVDIHTHTCTSVAVPCGKVNADFVALYIQYAAILQTIYTANNAVFMNIFPGFFGANVPAVNPVSKAILGFPDLCGGNITAPGKCNYYICATWMGGLTANFPQLTLPRLSGVSRALAAHDVQASMMDQPEVLERHLVASPDVNAGDSAYTTNNYVMTGFDASCIGSNGADCAVVEVAVPTTTSPSDAASSSSTSSPSSAGSPSSASSSNAPAGNGGASPNKNGLNTSSGVSAGAIAGSTIGVVAVVALGSALTVFLIRKRRAVNAGAGATPADDSSKV